MKLRIFSFTTLVLSGTLFFTSCKKNTDGSADSQTEIQAHAQDAAGFDAEFDALGNDVNTSIEASAALTGRTTSILGVCDADVAVNTSTNPMTLTITYNGTNCLGNRTRTGVVVVTMPQGTQWKNPGAAITVTFQQVKITRLSDSKSIVINGSQTYTNVSGGLLINLASIGTIIHTVTSNGITITFDNGTQRSWKVAKQRTFTYNNGIVISTTGTHTEGSQANVALWGTSRFGQAFTTAVTSPLVVRQSCNFRLTGGAILHTLPNISATATFGLDAQGNATGCPGTGNYYYKLAITASNGNTYSALVAY